MLATLKRYVDSEGSFQKSSLSALPCQGLKRSIVSILFEVFEVMGASCLGCEEFGGIVQYLQDEAHKRRRHVVGE